MMKKTILIAALFLLGGIIDLSGQIKQHSFVLNTRFNFSIKDSNSSPYPIINTSNLSSSNRRAYINQKYSFELGYLIGDNYLLGTIFQYSMWRKDKDSWLKASSFRPSNFRIQTTNLSWGIFLQKYFNLSSRWYFAPQIEAKYEHQNIKSNDYTLNDIGLSSTVEETLNTVNFVYLSSRLSLSVLFKLSEGFGLTTKFANYYSTLEIKSSINDRPHRGYTRLDINPLNWEFGLFFILNRRD